MNTIKGLTSVQKLLLIILVCCVFVGASLFTVKYFPIVAFFASLGLIVYIMRTGGR